MKSNKSNSTPSLISLYPIPYTFLILLFFPLLSTAQQFTQIRSGALVSTRSDSRSVNFIDVNNDGWEDIFISNGLSSGENNFLYLNQGDSTFLLDTSNPISQDNSSSVGASFADWDNDGDLDAHVSNWYGQVNQWYENDGTGQFILSSLYANLASFSETATWGDYDNDGLVDLYVTNSDGNRRNFLFHNLGSGSFAQIDTGAWVIEADLSRNANWTDHDMDGDIDLFVSNESNQHNDLFLNDTAEVFDKVIGSPVVSSNSSSMSTSWGDVDNDGDLDLFVANAGYFQEQNNQLYLQEDTGFVLISNEPVVTDGGCSYGSNFGDYDNDGDLDLVVSNGYCNSNLANFLYENQGDGSFVRSDSLLPNLPDICSYGAAWGDVNKDGCLDLMIANCKNNSTSPAPSNSFYLNNGNQNTWLMIQLEGVISNRSAIGAKVRVLAQINGQAVWQLREVSAQSGYAGQNSLIAHVGLGDAMQVDSLLIAWPSGLGDTLTALPVNQQLMIIEEVPIPNSIEEVKGSSGSIRCFPNPASEICQIEISIAPEFVGQEVTMGLFSLQGQELWHQDIQMTQVLLSTEIDLIQLRLPAGQYWLRARGDEFSLNYRILIRH